LKRKVTRLFYAIRLRYAALGTSLPSCKFLLYGCYLLKEKLYFSLLALTVEHMMNIAN